MRKFYFILMVLFCTTLFMGCDKDDDDDNGNGQGAGNGGSGVVVLAKKISKIVSSHNGTPGTTYFYAYDGNGRLTKITETYQGSTSEDVTNITYGDNKITLTSNGKEASVITLKDGRATSFLDYDGSDYRSEYTYTYAGKYLSKAVCKDFEKNKDTWESDGSDESTYTVKDGNLLNVVYSYNYGVDDTGKSTMTLEMSNTDNNTNIDLYGFVMSDELFLLCTVGDRYKKLPAKITDQEEGEKDDVTTYSYKTDKDGYITEMTETEDNGKYVTVYTITYE